MTVIEPRSAWNARPPRRVTPRPLSHFQGVRVHHSGGSAAASVRAIQDWDMDQKGLVDIGYSYVIRDGRVFEGRGTNHPAHDSINNTFGVCIIGTYVTSLPAAANLDALVACIRELRRMTGRRLAVDGHRDVAPTVCPGDALHRHLPTIRTRADQEEKMPTADEIAQAVLRTRVRWSNDWPVARWGMREDGFLVRTYLSQGYALSRSAHEGVSEILTGQAAILARLDGADDGATRQAIRDELERHRGELLSELRSEIGDLLDRRDELGADEVVRLIGERLLAGAEVSGTQVPTARVASDELVTSEDDD
jgi:hypothetical protein